MKIGIRTNLYQPYFFFTVQNRRFKKTLTLFVDANTQTSHRPDLIHRFLEATEICRSFRIWEMNIHLYKANLDDRCTFENSTMDELCRIGIVQTLNLFLKQGF